MSIAPSAGASSFTPPVAQSQALRSKPSGVDSDHDGDTDATESRSEKAKESQKLSPPVDGNRGRNLDVAA